MALYLPDGVRVYEPSEDQLVHATSKANAWLTGGAISAQGVPNMSVKQAAGTLAGNGGIIAVGATDPIAISAADPALPRIDLVVNDMTTGVASVVVGTPASTPKPPALPANKLLAAYISVAAAGVNIGSSNITDMRLLSWRVQIAGTLTQRPTASVMSGGTYFATDSGNVGTYRSDGVSWTQASTGTSGYLYLHDGNAAAPSLSWTNDPDTGFIRIGSNDIGIVVGGTLTVEIGATYLAIGTLPATTGAARLANAASISWSNAAHTADVAVLTLDGSNNVILSNTISAKSIVIQQTNGAGSVQLVVPAGGTLVFGNTAIDYLTSTATTGVIDFTATGSSANIDLRWVPKGTGLVDFRYAVTALGGGAVPTLGTIGGTGPAVQGQNSWLKVLINGVASFFPVWR